MSTTRRRKPRPRGVEPTPERMAKDDWDIASTERAGVFAKRVRSPFRVDEMLRDGRLNRDEHTVCMTYAASHHRAFGSDAQISRYDSNVIPGSRSPSQQHDLASVRALWCFLGVIDSKWMTDVVVEGYSIRDMEGALSIRNGTGLDKFKTAIQRTATHWGIPLDTGDG